MPDRRQKALGCCGEKATEGGKATELPDSHFHRKMRKEGPIPIPPPPDTKPHRNPCEMGALIIPIVWRRKWAQTGWATGFSKAVVDPVFEPSAMPWPKSPTMPANHGGPFPALILSVSLHQLALPISLLPWLLGASFPLLFPSSSQGGFP